jgi:hypothetical protein
MHKPIPALAIIGMLGCSTNSTTPPHPNYASIIDPASAGYNFEFTGGHPLLFYSTLPSQYGGINTARDLYSVPLAVTYR